MSVMRLLQWNLTYDKILRLEYLEKTTPVGFADGFALFIVDVKEKVNCLLLTERRKPMSFTAEEVNVFTSSKAKY